MENEPEIIHADFNGIGEDPEVKAMTPPAAGTSLSPGHRPGVIDRKKLALKKAVESFFDKDKITELLTLSMAMAKDGTLPGNTRTANIRMLLEYGVGRPENMPADGADGGAAVHFHFKETGEIFLQMKRAEEEQRRVVKRV